MPIPIYESGQSATDYLNRVIEDRPDREQQYQGALQQMKNSYAQRSVEGDDAAQWGALAKGFAQPAQNFWQSLANAGGHKADVVAGIENRNLNLGREAATKEFDVAAKLVQQEDMLARALATKTFATGAGGKSGPRPIKLADGTWATWDPLTSTAKPLAVSQQAQLQKTYDEYYKLGSKVLDTTDPTMLDAFAKKQVAERQAVYPYDQQAVQTPGGGMQPMPAPQDQPTLQGRQSPVEVAPSVDRQSMVRQLLKDYGDALDAGNSPRARELQDAINAMRNAPTGPSAVAPQGGLPQGGLPQVQAPQTAMPRLKSAEIEAEKEGRGKERGTSMEKYFHGLQTTGAASQTLNGQLNVMKELYTKHGDKIPSGELAPLVASIKSSLNTFGVDFNGVAPTDVLQGLGTMGALQTRTANGENLLPGAMSNYEDQLLQKTFPTIGKTKEGRLLQIEILQAQLRQKAELSSAAGKYYQQHGKLDSGWWADDGPAMAIAKKNPFLDPHRIAAMEAYAKRLSAGVK
jgi:hypothetical protein